MIHNHVIRPTRMSYTLKVSRCVNTLYLPQLEPNSTISKNHRANFFHEYTIKLQFYISKHISHNLMKDENQLSFQKQNRTEMTEIKWTSYWILELHINLFDYNFHAFKLPKNCILTKIITHAKHCCHLQWK